MRKDWGSRSDLQSFFIVRGAAPCRGEKCGDYGQRVALTEIGAFRGAQPPVKTIVEITAERAERGGGTARTYNPTETHDARRGCRRQEPPTQGERGQA